MNSPAEILQIWIGNGVKKANLPVYKMILLGMAAGMRPVMVPDQLQPDEEILEKAEAVLPSLFDVIGWLDHTVSMV